MRRSGVEILKDILLVVLFLATILLLYLTWTQRDTARRLRVADLWPGSRQVQTAPDAGDALEPVLAAYGKGNGSFVRPEGEDELWHGVLQQLRDACDGRGVSVAEIPGEQYRDLLSSYESLRISFDYSIPFAEFCRYCGARRILGAEGVGRFTSVIFFTPVPDSFFVETDDGRAFRAVAALESSPVPAASRLASVDGATYYFLQDVIGSGSLALIPLDYKSDLQIQFLELESALRLREAPHRLVAESVFGETVDFVRRITDDFGNVTYLYGYGQKSLTCNAGGDFEYCATVGAGQEGGFFEDLQTALDFVSAAGGWDALNEQQIDFRLSYAEDVPRGHHYCFKQSQCAGPAIEVEVVAGQVAYYRRNVAVASGGVQITPREAVAAANVVASNCNHIYNVLHDLTLTVDSDESLSYVADNVSNMQADHYRSPLEKALLPAWVVTMKDGTQFYFDLYSGTPLGYVR